MPLRKVDGGYRYGKRGKLYKGKDAKEKAKRQAKVIILSQLLRGKKPK